MTCHTVTHDAKGNSELSLEFMPIFIDSAIVYCYNKPHVNSLV